MKRIATTILAGAMASVLLVTAASALHGGSWDGATALPMPRARAAAGVIDGQVHLVGGITPFGTNVLEVYDPVADAWDTSKASAPTIRADAAAAVIDGRLYVAGGCVGPDCRVGITGLLERYDPATDTWSALAPMPTSRAFAAAGAIGGKLYVVGGIGPIPPSAPVFDTLEAYDPVTDTWTSLAPMPTARAGLAAAVIDDVLYAVGGAFAGPTGSTTGSLEAYDPATDTWASLTPMPTDRTSLAAAELAGRLLVVGGFSRSPASPPDESALEIYDPATDSWTLGPAMPTARRGLVAPVAHRRLFAIGGNAGGPTLAVHEVFAPSVDDQLEFLAADIDALVDAGILNGGQGNSLNKKLDGVAKKVDKGNLQAAVGKVSAFIDGVETFVADGVLTTEQGQQLVDSANALIDSILGG